MPQRLTTPIKELQVKLHSAAKTNSTRRFHALYDKIHRRDILEEAWRSVKTKCQRCTHRCTGGCAGVDGIKIKDLVQSEVASKLLETIRHELQQGTYTPAPVREAIKQEIGKKRPLGVPTIKDRIVQTATRIVIEPIFEADFADFSFGFRPNRGPHSALNAIRKAARNGYRYMVKIDIKGYFDNIDHDRLLEAMKTRISDRRALQLIWLWLKAGTDKGTRSKGTPQGGPISPLLANIYLNGLDSQWNSRHRSLGVLTRYADDIVISSRTMAQAKTALESIEKTLRNLGLEIHPTEPTNLNIPTSYIDFLGFRHRWEMTTRKDGHVYFSLQRWPTEKAWLKLKKRLTPSPSGNYKPNKPLNEATSIKCWLPYYSKGLSTGRRASLTRQADLLLTAKGQPPTG